MTRDDVVAEFGAEVLARLNFFARETTSPKEVGIYRDVDNWVVYLTDERGELDGKLEFDNESAALGDFTLLLRHYFRSRRDHAE
jgi:hypothetical protein